MGMPSQQWNGQLVPLLNTTIKGTIWSVQLYPCMRVLRTTHAPTLPRRRHALQQQQQQQQAANDLSMRLTDVFHLWHLTD